VKKNIFYNDKQIEVELPIKKFSYLGETIQKSNVDINKLLNRVKVDQKIEKKKSFIFFSFAIFLLGLTGTFVSIIR
tara:strand:- start:83 stop:310 length:228 start_codon:yes stop_codon:yes gene_type:complete